MFAEQTIINIYNQFFIIIEAIERKICQKHEYTNILRLGSKNISSIARSNTNSF